MTNLIIILIVLAIVGAALAYIIVQKKKGARCIGCPRGKSCGGSCEER